MNRRSILARLAAWLGITTVPTEHADTEDPRYCPLCIHNREKETRR